MEETKQIFKVQLSLATSDGQETVLIYNEDRSIMHQEKASKELAATMQNDPKMFFWGIIHPQTGKLELLGAAPEQPW